MFTLSLRGRYGVLTALRLHGALILMTLVLFNSTSPILQSLTVLVWFAWSVLVIKQAYANKENLGFNTEFSRQHALPATRRIARLLNIFSFTLLVFFGGGVFLMLLFGVIPKDEPLGLFVIGFYVGCMAALDITLRQVSRHDRTGS